EENPGHISPAKKHPSLPITTPFTCPFTAPHTDPLTIPSPHSPQTGRPETGYAKFPFPGGQCHRAHGVCTEKRASLGFQTFHRLPSRMPVPVVKSAGNQSRLRIRPGKKFL